MRLKFPFVPQHEAMDCGPACLAMVARYYGSTFSLDFLRTISHIDREGVSLAGIAEAADDIGFRALPVKLPIIKTESKPGLEQAPLPAILHWNQQHFVVLYRITKKNALIGDPAAGVINLPIQEFRKCWEQDNAEGIAMLLDATPALKKHAEEAISQGYSEEHTGKPTLWTFLFKYFLPHKKLFWQLVIGLGIGACISVLIPFVTQSIVDVAIKTKDHSFLLLILIGQFALIVGQTMVQFLQNWILLHVGSRINIALISDFLSKMMKLPLSWFDVKNEGDLMQRVSDHQRIQTFLTRNSLSIVFAVFNLAIFGLVLFIYDGVIFSIFASASILYGLWIWLFMARRKAVDYRLFHVASQNHNNLTEIIRGMSEIKLQNSQNKRKWLWTTIQARLFHVQMQSMALVQYQDIGGVFINRTKDVLITFFSANLVMKGELTLGAMLAIQYIIGQLNAPLEQLIQFARAAQDAKLSWDRVSEVHLAQPEELPGVQYLDEIPEGDIFIQDLSHKYNELSPEVLKRINLCIPRGRLTAIVGASGSGKTTLLKLLQGFYTPTQGSIALGATPLSAVRPRSWRANCGSVAQDGFIFSGSIAQNISESDVVVNQHKLNMALQTANIYDFVNSLPLRTNTKIGAGGNGISSGQRQRMLIARAVYKNPEFLFFDEATNALDAQNESVIVKKLEEFFHGKTVIVVAHRLSTVRNADNIIVLEHGQIVEQGTHNELVLREGRYFELIRNQLELGS